MNTSVLLVDDERTFTDSFAEALRSQHGVVDHCYMFHEAMRYLEGTDYDVCVFDIFLPDGSGIDLVKQVMALPDGPEVILITASSLNSDSVNDAIRDYIFDYLQKPFEMNHALKRVRNAAERRLTEVARRQRTEQEAQSIHLIGIHADIRRIRGLVAQVSDVPSPVLISGETGTGKELVARAIHFRSSRRGPFVPVNCSAVPRELFEAEFFGFEKGAFTGADSARKGLFELADKGTLFLDEIGEMDLGFQSKLLRVLENGEYRRLGDHRIRRSSARILAATNRNLEREVTEGRFRKDLYYRISVVKLFLPALRNRKEDIPLLARHLWNKLAGQLGRKILPPDEGWFQQLRSGDWPGNVRELANRIERTLILGDLHVSPGDSPNEDMSGRVLCSEQEIVPLNDLIRNHILHAYQVSGKNKKRTSELLGLSLSTLKRRLREMGIGIENGSS